MQASDFEFNIKTSVFNPALEITPDYWAVSMVRTSYNAGFSTSEQEALDSLKKPEGIKKYGNQANIDEVIKQLECNMQKRRMVDAENVFLLIQKHTSLHFFSISTVSSFKRTMDSAMLIEKAIKDLTPQAAKFEKEDEYYIRDLECSFKCNIGLETQFNSLVWDDQYTENTQEQLGHKTWRVDSSIVRKWIEQLKETSAAVERGNRHKGRYFEGGYTSHLDPEYVANKSLSIKTGLAFIGASIFAYLTSRSSDNPPPARADAKESGWRVVLPSEETIVRYGLVGATGIAATVMLYRTLFNVRHNSTSWCIEQLRFLSIPEINKELQATEEDSIKCAADQHLVIPGEDIPEINKIKADIRHAYLAKYAPSHVEVVRKRESTSAVGV